MLKWSIWGSSLNPGKTNQCYQRASRATKKDILVPGYRLPGISACLCVCLYVYLCVTWGARMYFRGQNSDFGYPWDPLGLLVGAPRASYGAPWSPFRLPLDTSGSPSASFWEAWGSPGPPVWRQTGHLARPCKKYFFASPHFVHPD